MKSYFHYLTVAGFLIASTPAVCQDALKTWLYHQNISNVPSDIQDQIVPGGFVLESGTDGSTKFAAPSDTVFPYTTSALAKNPLPTITVAGIDDDFTNDKNLGLGFLGLSFGLAKTNVVSTTSDQAVMSIARVASDPRTIESFIYNDPGTQQVYDFWNPPTQKYRTGNVYFVEAVYYAKELTIKEVSKKDLNGNFSGTLPKCTTGKDSDSSAPKNSSSADKGSNGASSNATKNGSVGAKASIAGVSSASTAPTGVTDAFTQFVKNIVSNKIQLSGGSCVDADDTAHLKSDVPIPIGMTIDLIAYFKHGRKNKLDYESVTRTF